MKNLIWLIIYLVLTGSYFGYESPLVSVSSFLKGKSCDIRALKGRFTQKSKIEK